MSTPGGPGPLRIPDDKIVRYLLNPDHPKGGPKARFFLSFGFDPAAPDAMVEALAIHATRNRRVVLPATADAPERMVVEGPMPSPDGRNPDVRSVWHREDGDAWAWRLITAVPLTR